LAAAHRLQRLLPHAQLQVFEASDRLGGPLCTLRNGDSLLEQGADSFLMKTPWALDLCRELGLADQLIPTNEHYRRALVVHDGRLLPVPEGFVLMRAQNVGAMLRTPLLSLRGKLRLLLEPLMRAPADARSPNYDESVASFATRRLGRETYERLVQPLVAGIFVADATRLSLAATFPEFLKAEREHGSLWRSVRSAKDEAIEAGEIYEARSAKPPFGRELRAERQSAARYGQFVTLRNGVSALIEALMASLPTVSIRKRTPVEAVTAEGASRWVVKPDSGPLEAFDGVILATQAPIAAEMLSAMDRELSYQLARIEYASSAVVTLVYRQKQITHALDGFGAVVPAIENRPIVAVSFLSTKFPSHAPGDRAVLRVFLGGALRPEMVDKSNEELIAIAAREMAELLGARGEPMETHVARWRESMPQYQVGHLELVAAIESRVAEHRGLELAGNAYRGVGIPQCVRSGREAAERLAAQLTGKSRLDTLASRATRA
jgi:oxygen-dependent protoporphyrinogen oxidase